MTEHESGSRYFSDLATLMQQMQQRLLAAGYTYVAGDPAAWPLTDVVMAKEDAYLLIAVWSPDRMISLRNRWTDVLSRTKDIGLLLIGTESPASDHVQEFFHLTQGATAYVDAASRYFQLRKESSARIIPDVMQEEALANLLDPQRATEVAHVDARTALLAHGRMVADAAAQSEVAAPTAATCYVTYTIITLCCLMFLVTLYYDGLSGMMGVSNAAVIKLGALYGPLVRQGEWWRIITVAYLHGSVIHLGMNMLALFYFGTMLERWLGHGRLAVVYVFSGITGALASLWWHPGIVGVGASGAIFGLLGVMLAIYWRYRQDFPATVRVQYISWLKKLLLYNLMFSLIPGIDLAAHAGGLVGGFLLGAIIANSPYQQTTSPK